MSRPTTRIRLRDLDPTAVADDVQRQCVDHLARLGMAVGYDTRESAPSTLHSEVLALVQWAQHGRAWDWQDGADAWDAASSITSALYDSAARHGEVGELIGDADPDTAIGVVLVAVHCRVSIEQGEYVSARQLAALAGVDIQHVRRMARDGEIRSRDDGTFTPREASRWLGARGIAPYAIPEK